MKNMFLAIFAMAAMVATPSMAQTGTVALGGGYGDGVGNQSITSNQTVANNSSHNLQIDVEHSISGASGSGFGGAFDVNGLANGGTSMAAFSGSGLAGTLVAEGNGVGLSISGNTGNFTASAAGNASVNGDVMNFGQSQFTNSFTFSFDRQRSASFTDSNMSSTNVSLTDGNVGFGALGWDAEF